MSLLKKRIQYAAKTIFNTKEVEIEIAVVSTNTGTVRIKINTKAIKSDGEIYDNTASVDLITKQERKHPQLFIDQLIDMIKSDMHNHRS